MAVPTGINEPAPGSLEWTWVGGAPDGNRLAADTAGITPSRDFAPGEYAFDMQGLATHWSSGGGWIVGAVPVPSTRLIPPVAPSREWTYDRQPRGDLADINASGLGSGPAWPADEYIYLSNGTWARWDGNAFVATQGPTWTTPTFLAPGQVVPPDAAVGSLIELRNSMAVGDHRYGSQGHLGQPWAAGEYVNIILQPGDPDTAPTGPVYWDGSKWTEGIAPVPEATTVMEGHPGSFGPTGANYANIAALRANPYFGTRFNAGHPAWTTGDYVTLADGSDAYWDGGQWQAGRAGSPSGPLAPVPVYVPTGITPPTGGAKEWTWQPAAFSAEIADIQASLPTLTPSRDFVDGEYVTDSTGAHFYWTHYDAGAYQAGDAPPALDAVIAGTPGTWVGTDDRPNSAHAPATIAEAQSLVTDFMHWSDASQTTVRTDAAGAPWEVGEYILLADGSTEIWWDGSTWQAGRATLAAMTDPTSIAAGTPGPVTPAGAAVAGIAELRHHPTLGNNAFTGAPWAKDEYVNIIQKPGDPVGSPSGKAYWDGAGWQTGKAPAAMLGVVPGTPGQWINADGHMSPTLPGRPLNFAALSALTLRTFVSDGSGGVTDDATAWTAGSYLELEDGSHAFWDGSGFVAGEAGSPTPPHVPVDFGTFPDRQSLDATLAAHPQAPAFGEGDTVTIAGTQSTFTSGAWAPPLPTAPAPQASTRATAGTPGGFDHDTPADLAAIQALGALGNSAPWAPGEYVQLGAGDAYWDGTAWQSGVAPQPTHAHDATPGAPGAFVPATATAPATKAELDAVVGGAAWTNQGDYVTVGGTDYYWDGAAWQAGRVPAPVVYASGATPGTPGQFTPAGSVPPATKAVLDAINPGAAWTTPGDYIAVAGQNYYWDGATWQSGVVPTPDSPPTGVRAGTGGVIPGRARRAGRACGPCDAARTGRTRASRSVGAR